MNLYLMRHGIARPKDNASSADDAERPLTNKGAKRMRKAARGLRALGIRFDCILTSPLIRARQSAEIVASALGLEPRLEEIAGLAPDSNVEHLLSSLAGYRDRKHLLLLGHEPLLSSAAVFLLGGGHSAAVHIEFKEGGLCRIEIDALSAAAPGTLRWLLTPKQLRLLG